MGSFTKYFGKMILFCLGFAFLSFLHPFISVFAASGMAWYLGRNGRKYLAEYAEEVFLGVAISLASFLVFQKTGIAPGEAFLWALGVLNLFLLMYELRVRRVEKKGVFVNPSLR